MLGVHQLREGGAVGFIPDVGGLVSVRLGVGNADAALRPLGQPQGDSNVKDGGGQELLVLGR